MPEMITSAEAAALLGKPKEYWYVQWFWRRGLLKQVRVSERKRMYYKAEVLKLANDATKH